MKLKDEHKNLLLGALAAKTFQSKPKEKKENVFFSQFSKELNLFQKLWTWIFWVIIFLSKKFFTIILIIALLAVIANFFMLVTEEYNESRAFLALSLSGQLSHAQGQDGQTLAISNGHGDAWFEEQGQICPEDGAAELHSLPQHP